MAHSPDTRPGGGRGDLLALAAVVALGGLLASLSPSGNAAVASRLRGTVLAPFLSAHRAVRQHADLSRRLERLRSERDSLARELVTARARAARSGRLRELLSVAEGRAGRVVTAELEPARLRLGAARAFSVGVGTRDGVTPPAGVFTAGGLVGVVRRAAAGSARGEFWTHPDFRVSVRTREGDASGIVRPTYEADQPVMLLEGAPYQQELAEGTVMYTSGLGGVYPEGIPVGTVRSVSSVESGWEKSYRLEAAVRPERVDVGMVWIGPAAEADGPAEAPPSTARPEEAGRPASPGPR